MYKSDCLLSAILRLVVLQGFRRCHISLYKSSICKTIMLSFCQPSHFQPQTRWFNHSSVCKTTVIFSFRKHTISFQRDASSRCQPPLTTDSVSFSGDGFPKLYMQLRDIIPSQMQIWKLFSAFKMFKTMFKTLIDLNKRF